MASRIGDSRPGRSGLAALRASRGAPEQPHFSPRASPIDSRGPVSGKAPSLISAAGWSRVLVALAALAVGGLVLMAASRTLSLGVTGAVAAEREVRVKPGAICDLETAAAVGAANPNVDQLIVMTTESFNATEGAAFAAVRLSDDTWGCQTDIEFARFGKSGTRELSERRSGDGTTPAGVFPLGTQTAWDGQQFQLFGNRPDPGVHSDLTYRSVHPDDCWGATPGQSTYQQLIPRSGCQAPDEWLPRFGDVYGHAAVIGANLDPVSGDAPDEPPYAAAIFLHRHSYADAAATLTKPTSGCVSVNQEALTELIRLLDPELNPHFAIGPVGWLRGDG